jgi:hypothetical protein
MANKNLPRQESDHETKPREEEDSSIFVEGVENWNRSSLSIDWINLGRLPKSSDFESHDWRFVQMFPFVKNFSTECLAAIDAFDIGFRIVEEKRTVGELLDGVLDNDRIRAALIKSPISDVSP